MPYLDGARGRLHHRRWPVEDPVAALALLPGIGQHSAHYHRFARALNAERIELWTLDTSGHGLSEGDPDRPGTLAELTADAHTFLDPIRPGVPLILMGHSLGAATALAVIASHPEPRYAGLILSGTPKAALEGREPKSARGANPVRAGRLSPAGAMAPAGVGAARIRALGAEVGESGWTGPILPARFPLLILHGCDDRRAPLDPVRDWARGVSAEFHEYPDTGHDILHEPAQARATADITAWVGNLVTD